MAEIPSHPVFGGTTGWNGMRKKPGAAAAAYTGYFSAVICDSEEAATLDDTGSAIYGATTWVGRVAESDSLTCYSTLSPIANPGFTDDTIAADHASCSECQGE